MLRAFVAFFKRGHRLSDPILGKNKVRWAQARHIVSLVIDDRHIQLHHGHDNTDNVAAAVLRGVLRGRPNRKPGEQNQNRSDCHRVSFCHMILTLPPGAFEHPDESRTAKLVAR